MRDELLGYYERELIFLRRMGADFARKYPKIVGQLTASVVIDRLGVLGLEQVTISLDRVIGIGLLLLGTYLIVR